jgi:hypothetical protein
VDTPRQRQRLWAEQQQLLGYVLPLHTLVLLLGLVFCVASPLIAPVTLLYFVSASVAQRYQWIYIYRHPYEGAGTLWRQVFNQVGVWCCNRLDPNTTGGYLVFVCVRVCCLLGASSMATCHVVRDNTHATHTHWLGQQHTCANRPACQHAPSHTCRLCHLLLPQVLVGVSFFAAVTAALPFR